VQDRKDRDEVQTSIFLPMELTATLAEPLALAELSDDLTTVQHFFHQVERSIVVMIGRLITDRGIVSSNQELALG
jgi:hypothetical protein